jgi:hypothetical protein
LVGQEPNTHSGACCTKATAPNVLIASLIPPGPGGGKIGAVVVSQWIRRRSIKIQAS